MKRSITAIAVTLILCMCLPLFAACDLNGIKTETTEKKETTATTVKADETTEKVEQTTTALHVEETTEKTETSTKTEAQPETEAVETDASDENTSNPPTKPNVKPNTKPNITAAKPQPEPTEPPKSEATESITEESTRAEETTTFEEDTYDENVLGEPKNYDDEFYLSILPDVNPMNYYWADPEKTNSSMMYEALYARQQKVYEQLGVEIYASSAGNHMTYLEPFKNAVKTMDGSRDTLISHVHTGVPHLVSEMYLRDFGQMPGIDLNADYWNLDFMDSLSIPTSSGDYYFLGFSDFNILYTHVVAFNKTMMEQKTSGILEKSVYQLVDDYEWTLDQMLSLAQLVSEDPSNDGKTTDDTYGLTGQQWVPWIGLLHASNINYVEINETGKYGVSLMNETYKEKSSNLVTKLRDFSASQYGYFTFPTPGTSGVPAPIKLTTGRALMQLTSTHELVAFLDSDITFGVLPYPMYDRDQKDVGYRSLQWGGYLCIPAYLRNKDMVGDTLEALAYYSEDVHTAFYDRLLGRQISDMPDDARMLEIVWDSVCTDFGQTYSEICEGILYVLPRVTWTGEGGQELASTVTGKMENSVNKSINKFMKIVEKNLDRISPPDDGYEQGSEINPDEWETEIMTDEWATGFPTESERPEEPYETEEPWEVMTTEPIEEEIPETEAPWY